MKYVFLIINWIFGIFLLLVAAISLTESPISGLCLIVASALLIPPVKKFIQTKTNKALTTKFRLTSVLILVIAFLFFANHAKTLKDQKIAERQARVEQEKQDILQQKAIDFFNHNRTQIISNIKNEISKENLQAALLETKKYIASDDKEILELFNTSKNLIDAKKILNELKGIPVINYEKNQDLYQKLITIYPDNKLYISKVKYYSKKKEELKIKQLAAKLHKEKINSQFSPWDGSHRNLERLIKKSMNDPDSYEHNKTVYWDHETYLIVKTTFRGKNGFGALIKNTVEAKVDLDGQILQVLRQY